MSQRPERAPLIVGRYALYDDIAAGGMASVHLGRQVGDAGFSRTVAIKRLHPQFSKDPDFVAMLVDEGRLAERIRHTNVVAVLDVVSTGGELLLVMEYIHGEALSKLISRMGKVGQRIPLPHAVSILVGLLQGLHAAHEATDGKGGSLGIVHRDVSPENVLVGADGVARVLDFGIALAEDRAQTTRDGQLKGKLAYMSPEQVSSGTVDRRADIYSAGVVAWEMLAGLRLFRADNKGAILLDIVQGKVEPLRTHAPDVPEALEAVVMKALARDPADRYATAEELATALEDAVTPSPSRQVGRWVGEIAKDTLETRRGLISRIEDRASMTDSSSSPVAVVPLPPAPEASSPGVSDVSSSAAGGTAIGSTISTMSEGFAQPRRRVPVWSVLLGLSLLVGTVGAFVIMKRTTDSGAGSGAALPAGQTASPPAPATATALVSTTTVAPVTDAQPGASASAASASPSASATAAPVVVQAPPRPPVAQPPKPPAPNCNPSYFIDAKGVKRYKKECLK